MNISDIEVAWSVVGKFAIILGVIVGIVQGVKYLNSLSPTTKLEKRIGDAEEKLRNDYERLNDIDRRIEALEHKVDDTQKQIHEVNEGIQRIGKSQISLLRHMIDGNGIDKMKQEVKELTEYFIDR